jgi:hypothetical protein
MKLLLFIVLLVSLTPTPRLADCVCVKESHPTKEKIKAERRQAYDKATAVFEGKVVALDSYTVTFRLQKRWKGSSHDEVVLSTGAVPGYNGTPLPEECSFQFQLGEEYLVYAYGPAEKLKTSVCSTLMIKDAAEEEKGLDEIGPHETLREKSNERPQILFLSPIRNKENPQGWWKR